MLKTVTEHIPLIDMTVNIITEERSISGNETDNKKNTVESHVHEGCEIYINLTGNVSFMVEKNIYKIKSGDVIITRPFEYHHCINHSDEPHNHICIFFSCDDDKGLFKVFFERNLGEKNHISLPETQKEKLISLCNAITDSNDKMKKYSSFFSVIELISNDENINTVSELPEDVEICIEYINTHLTDDINVIELSEVSFVTVNTLERHFKKYVGMSPYTYIQNCRLARAASMLEKGMTVSQAAEKSGFNDYSHFIRTFKSIVGVPPKQYLKRKE